MFKLVDNQSDNRRTRQQGFTMIELMFVVAIVGILTAIAIPWYNDYVKRGKINDATSQLSAARVQMEQFFQDSATHAYNDPASPCLVAGWPASTPYFTFTCATADATHYTITATGQTSGGMAGFKYTIDQDNTKATTGLPTAWGTAPATCWAIRKGGSCV